MFFHSVDASHLVGGEIYYKHLSDSTYKVTLKIYRDCNSKNQNGGLTPFDSPGLIAIYEGNNLLGIELLSHSNPTKVPVIVNNPCLTAPPNICVDEAVYEGIIKIPSVHNGITLTYQRCCRNQSIQNIVGPPPFFSGSNGSTYTTEIPPTSLFPNENNSSPVFKNFPPLVICLNDAIKFNHSAIDDDGDSLIYELCDPFVGLTPGFPEPNTTNNLPKPPPYSSVPYATGFSSTNPITANPGISINARTGLLTGTPTIQGQFVVAVCVSEYRRGQLLSTVRRDFQFNVTFCNAEPVAAANTQESFCDGLEVRFKNNSTNAKYFEWDFGDPSTNNDTSTQKEPSYTYPDTGKYTITLIVNKGWPCADTATTIYAVYDKLLAFYKRDEGQCFDGHSFNFKAGGLFQDYATFEWNFGDYGSPTKSYVQNPENIKFTRPEDHLVKLTIRENGCEGVYLDTIKVYPNPVAEFDIEKSKGCMPFPALFNNYSKAWTNMSFLWDFGDNTTSIDPNPEHIYNKPGIYDVSLRTITEDVCSDTSLFEWKKLVQVNDLPIAGLLIENRNLTSNNNTAKFTNVSQKSDRCKLLLGDGSTSALCDLEYTYRDTGTYNIVQIAFTRNGCRDTFFDQVIVRPDLLFFAPNAFTPNGDNVNEYYMPIVYGVRKYRFQVMSRWGEILFETERKNYGWDGQNPNGKDSPQDGYVYIVHLTDAYGKDHEYRGVFSLLR